MSPRATIPLVLLAILDAREAQACKPSLPAKHVVDPGRQATDRQAPRLTMTPSVIVHRGVDPDLSACDRNPTGDTCLDNGQLIIVVAATDDQTPAAESGFRLAVAGGRPPDGLHLPAHDVRALDGQIILPWADSATNGPEPFSFALSVSPVDGAGNVGPSFTISVASEGDGGCAVGGGGRPGTWLLLALLLFWAALRRERLHCRHARGS